MATLFVFLRAMPALAQAPSKSRAVVMDQTTLPLPGVRVDMYRGDQIIQSTVTAGDGTFELLPGPATDLVEATLEGLKRSACRGAPPIASSWPSHTRPTSPR